MCFRCPPLELTTCLCLQQGAAADGEKRIEEYKRDNPGMLSWETGTYWRSACVSGR